VFKKSVWDDYYYWGIDIFSEEESKYNVEHVRYNWHKGNHLNKTKIVFFSLLVNFSCHNRALFSFAYLEGALVASQKSTFRMLRPKSFIKCKKQ